MVISFSTTEIFFQDQHVGHKLLLLGFFTVLFLFDLKLTFGTCSRPFVVTDVYYSCTSL